MSGVIEAAALLSGIAAIVSTYKDAGGRFRFWKAKKRNAKVEPESAALEDSLHHVPHGLERRYHEGCRCLGSSFADGDEVAKESMWKALVNFNKTLLESLQMAISRGLEPNLSHLLHTSQSTGRETDSVLKDLYQRVLQAKRMPRNLSPPPLPSEARQAMHEMFWEDQANTPLDRMSVISRNSSTRSVRSAPTSEDVLQANLERLAKYSIQKTPTTSMNAIVSKYTSVRSTTSADVLRRNKAALSG